MKLLSDKKILVVDDEQIICEILKEEFSNHGATVSIAENGIEAFNLLKESAFDILVTDIRMPKGDGISLLKKIKNEMPDTKLKIFVRSGFNDLGEQEAKDLNVLYIFEKPSRLDFVTSTIRKLIEK